MAHQNPAFWDKLPGESTPGQTARVGLMGAGLLGIVYYGGKFLRDSLTFSDDGGLGSGLLSNISWFAASLVAFPFLFLQFPAIGRWLNGSVWPYVKGAGEWVGDKVTGAAEYTGGKLGLTNTSAPSASPQAPSTLLYTPETPRDTRDLNHEVSLSELGQIAPPVRSIAAGVGTINKPREIVS